MKKCMKFAGLSPKKQFGAKMDSHKCNLPQVDEIDFPILQRSRFEARQAREDRKVVQGHYGGEQESHLPAAQNHLVGEHCVLDHFVCKFLHWVLIQLVQLFVNT